MSSDWEQLLSVGNNQWSPAYPFTLVKEGCNFRIVGSLFSNDRRCTQFGNRSNPKCNSPQPYSFRIDLMHICLSSVHLVRFAQFRTVLQKRMYLFVGYSLFSVFFSTYSRCVTYSTLFTVPHTIQQDPIQNTRMYNFFFVTFPVCTILIAVERDAQLIYIGVTFLDDIRNIFPRFCKLRELSSIF